MDKVCQKCCSRGAGGEEKGGGRSQAIFLSGRNILSLNSRKIMKQSAGCLRVVIKEKRNQTKPGAVSW